MTGRDGFEAAPQEPAAPRFEPGPGSLLAGYLRTLRSVLRNPSTYFRTMPVAGGLAGPLAFALVTHWIGAAIGHLWSLLLSGVVSDSSRSLYRIIADLGVSHWIWGTGSILLDPFLTLASILFTSSLVWIAARLLVSNVRYESAARIVCFGMSPAILASLPLFGRFLAESLTLIVTVIGAREVYRVGYGRALVIALFPKLLFLGIMVLGPFFLVLSMLKLVATAI